MISAEIVMAAMDWKMIEVVMPRKGFDVPFCCARSPQSNTPGEFDMAINWAPIVKKLPTRITAMKSNQCQDIFYVCKIVRIY